jgi:hypothetical protein
MIHPESLKTLIFASQIAFLNFKKLFSPIAFHITNNLNILTTEFLIFFIYFSQLTNNYINKTVIKYVFNLIKQGKINLQLIIK